MVETSTKEFKTAERDTTGWSAPLYNKTAAFVYSSANTLLVLDLLNARPGERILDVGCGSGEITMVLQDIVGKAPGGLVVGTDASQSMIEKATKNGVKHVFLADAQDLKLPEVISWEAGKFDAVFSNATLHWCKRDPLGVLTGIQKILKPGGRLALEMGGFTNCIGIRSVIHSVMRSKGHNPEALDPWYFPTVQEYSKLLESAGFDIVHISLTPRMTELNSGIFDWLNLFARTSFLRDLNDAEATEIMRKIEEECRVDCQDSSGNWWIMYTRLRVSAVLK